MTICTRIVATPQYPGSFPPEEEPEEGPAVDVSDAKPETVLAVFSGDDKWFAIEVFTIQYKIWTDDKGNRTWVPMDQSNTYCIYRGEKLTVTDVENLPGDHHILLSNMKVHGYDWAVQFHHGEIQMLEEEDVVI